MTNEFSKATEAARPGEWKTRTTAIGGVLGALTGAGAAYLFVKSGGVQGKSRVKPDALLAVGISVLALLQQISRMGDD
ncbi:MAG TPA: hypothetical protein VFF59_01925 [Anaerolineae bacterium]|nr:hypothetical protein [Anaerolineae bacterium]